MIIDDLVDLVDETSVLSLYDDEMDIVESKDQLMGDSVSQLDWRPFEFPSSEDARMAWDKMTVPGISITPPSPTTLTFGMDPMGFIPTTAEYANSDMPYPAVPLTPVKPRKRILDSILCTPRLKICKDLMRETKPFDDFRAPTGVAPRRRSRSGFQTLATVPEEEECLNAAWEKKCNRRAMAALSDDDILSQDNDKPIDDEDKFPRPHHPLHVGRQLKRLQRPSRRVLTLVSKLALKRLNQSKLRK